MTSVSQEPDELRMLIEERDPRLIGFEAFLQALEVDHFDIEDGMAWLEMLHGLFNVHLVSINIHPIKWESILKSIY